MADQATEVLSSLDDIGAKIPRAIAELMEQRAAIDVTLARLRRLEKMVNGEPAAKKPPKVMGSKTATNVRLARQGKLSPLTLRVAQVIKQLATERDEYTVADVHRRVLDNGDTWTDGATRDAMTKLRAIEYIRVKGKIRTPKSPTPSVTYALMDADAVDRLVKSNG